MPPFLTYANAERRRVTLYFVLFPSKRRPVISTMSTQKKEPREALQGSLSVTVLPASSRFSAFLAFLKSQTAGHPAERRVAKLSAIVVFRTSLVADFYAQLLRFYASKFGFPSAPIVFSLCTTSDEKTLSQGITRFLKGSRDHGSKSDTMATAFPSILVFTNESFLSELFAHISKSPSSTVVDWLVFFDSPSVPSVSCSFFLIVFLLSSISLSFFNGLYLYLARPLPPRSSCFSLKKSQLSHRFFDRRRILHLSRFSVLIFLSLSFDPSSMTSQEHQQPFHASRYTAKHSLILSPPRIPCI
jgi:hypothetical protein